ncbi:hypothetical protein BCR35DRAFT_155800 [Leucosporidium creatinivorum]|uniref:Uncharacterized protein n=1 Tax=Leucosporidium creatinivorum TaxID=106004 RepID=A0A1Y2G3P3_9BASI|nr:hypothetical protein BCR35DRAFT_155800 [Leucosporidium creatinivorum]
MKQRSTTLDKLLFSVVFIPARRAARCWCQRKGRARRTLHPAMLGPRWFVELLGMIMFSVVLHRSPASEEQQRAQPRSALGAYSSAREEDQQSSSRFSSAYL